MPDCSAKIDDYGLRAGKWHGRDYHCHSWSHRDEEIAVGQCCIRCSPSVAGPRAANQTGVLPPVAPVRTPPGALDPLEQENDFRDDIRSTDLLD